KEALYHYETVLAIRRYHIADLRLRILELGDFTDITARRPFIDLAGEWYFLETECSFFNYSLFDMLLRLVKSGDVTTHEDVYAKINIDCRT
ncbi:hypothetical protein AAVH_38454, partial [Aphelenchoides avenae]